MSRLIQMSYSEWKLSGGTRQDPEVEAIKRWYPRGLAKMAAKYNILNTYAIVLYFYRAYIGYSL